LKIFRWEVVLPDTPAADAPSDERGAAKKEAFHRAAEAAMKPFAFVRPDVEISGRKGLYYLAHSDILKAAVQILNEGGDNVLHYHPGTDGFWMVLQGRVRFYGPDGVIGEFGPCEGLSMPRNARYWFETASPGEEVHLLQIGVKTQRKQNNKVTLGPFRPNGLKILRLNFPPGSKGSDD
jgi:mannose-6-phosphate isomerase-like protein (cupin superfamily)